MGWKPTDARFRRPLLCMGPGQTWNQYNHTNMSEFFRRFSQKAAELLGSAWAFVAAALIIIVWATTGPLFGFSDTWQLVINTGTTIITFLMVFLIQNTQNRDTKAIHLKIDELIRAQSHARNSLIRLEEMSDGQLEDLHQEFRRISQQREHHRSHKPHAAAASQSDRASVVSGPEKQGG